MSEKIHSLIERLNAVTEDVKAAFGSFNEEQLNWKPSEDSWSVGQCLDHLITSNAAYFPILEGVVEGTYRPSGWSKLPLAADFFGKMLIKAVHPDSVKKNKTFPVFEPSKSGVPGTIVDDFCSGQEELKVLIEKLDDEELLAGKVSSPVSSFITLRTGDALEVLVLHERRHFNQAVRVTEFTAFPAKAA